MNKLHGNNSYVQSSIGVSRIFQEKLEIVKGNTFYGTLASLIDTNIASIDKFAKYLGNIVAENTANKMYEKQYGHGIVGVVRRSATDNETGYANEIERRTGSFITGVATEMTLKFGARWIGKIASEKDHFEFFKQVYTFLYGFAHSSNENIIKVDGELNKILYSFPLSEKHKCLIAVMPKETPGMADCNENTISMILKSNDGLVKDNVSFFLYSLYAQKYEMAAEKSNVLLKYYNILGYHGKMANEIMAEQSQRYNKIAGDQRRYLKIARGMVQNFDSSLPEINIKNLIQRANNMAANDPYKIIKGQPSPRPGTKKKISDIFFENPEFVMNAAATALSQFGLSDDGKESIRSKLMEWGFDSNAAESSIDQSEIIKDESQNLNFKEE